jgi:DNA repair protein RadD
MMSNEWTGQILAEYLMGTDLEDVRGVTFRIPKTGLPVPELYPHQKEALTKLTARSVSTILHLPTGSGKTRIALELIARVLLEKPQTKIVWASYPTTLIRQSMIRLAQFSSQLPTDLRFCWEKSNIRSRNIMKLFHDHDVVFTLRGTLTSLLADVSERPTQSPILDILYSKTPLLIIYDECHQLGARLLQRALRKVDKTRPVDSMWPRIVGLSATPLPRNPRRRILFRKLLFPCAPTTVQHPDYTWHMDVAYRVNNASLESIGVLCPINAYQQRSGFFDVPIEIIDRASRGRPIEEPPATGASGTDLLHFSSQFNAKIMSHPVVLRFLAGRIATRIEELGKTLVFVPTIRAANSFFTLLEAHPATRGRVYLVHTKLGEMHQDHPDLRVYDQIQQFSDQGNRPCVMVNVNMLTTGFDDPKIRTIVLARLTYSMNLYWQMIGRGARGPKSGGTTDCNVLDPIRLTRLYPIADGYRPTLTRSNDNIVSGEDIGAGRLDPSLTIVEHAHNGPGPLADSVDESWFDTVVLNEKELTAFHTPPQQVSRSKKKKQTATFTPPQSIQEGLQRHHVITGEQSDVRSRLWALILALEGDTVQRVAIALGMPFAGTILRESAADEIMDALCVDGRSGTTAFFDAIPSTELRHLVHSLGLPLPIKKKAAFVTSLVFEFLLDNPLVPTTEALSHQDISIAGLNPGALYAKFECNFNKKELQNLLEHLGQPRSAKNKGILIRRIMETFLYQELSL